MPFVIRPFLSADVDAVTRIVVDGLAEHGLASKAEHVARDLRDAHVRYVPPEAGFWVAEIDGVVVGTVAVRAKEGRTCELKRLYLRADRRGHGDGQRLYAHAEAFARGAGYDRIWLDSSRRFDKARRLYERNGFALLEEIDNDWEDNVYEKRLA